MKLFIYSIFILVIVFGIVLIAFSISSRKQPELGLVNGQLRPCPAIPNCVCSEYNSGASFITPFDFSTTTTDAWDDVKQAIAKTGGTVISDKDGYLHAEYQTPLLRYIDDVELRIDDNAKIIHIRSASRVGQSDLGTNRKRVEKIRKIFANNGNTSK